MIRTPDHGELAVGDLGYLLHSHEPSVQRVKVADVGHDHESPSFRPEWSVWLELPDGRRTRLSVGAHRESRLLFATPDAADRECRRRLSDAVLAGVTRDRDTGPPA